MNPDTCQVPDKMSGNMMPLSGKKPGMRPAPPGICVRYGRHQVPPISLLLPAAAPSLWTGTPGFFRWIPSPRSRKKLALFNQGRGSSQERQLTALFKRPEDHIGNKQCATQNKTFINLQQTAIHAENLLTQKIQRREKTGKITLRVAPQLLGPPIVSGESPAASRVRPAPCVACLDDVRHQT
jgi:hypothetical protein